MSGMGGDGAELVREWPRARWSAVVAAEADSDRSLKLLFCDSCSWLWIPDMWLGASENACGCEMVCFRFRLLAWLIGGPAGVEISSPSDEWP
jgi:hypothetical protein